MKKVIFAVLIVVFLFPVISDLACADDRPRIGVLRFTNRVGNLGWWNTSVARELQDMLISELASTEEFVVLERKELGAVLSEQDLSASGRVSKKTLVKMRKIKGAQFLIAGTVSAFEKKSSTGGGIRIKMVRLGGKKMKTYIAVDVKVINAETGEIVDTRTIEATIKARELKAGVSFSGFGANVKDAKKTPTGKAIRACLMHIIDYLTCSMIEGKNAPCMKKWRKMEKKRRKKTKSVLSLE